WAVASASPFGNSRRRRAVSDAIRTRPCATARRRERGFAPTSTMRTPPASSTWDNSFTRDSLAATALREPRGGPSERRWLHGPRPVEIRQLGGDPGGEIVRPHVRPDRLDALAPFRLPERECRVNRIGLPDDVERVHAQRPASELLVGARVLRED